MYLAAISVTNNTTILGAADWVSPLIHSQIMDEGSFVTDWLDMRQSPNTGWLSYKDAYLLQLLQSTSCQSPLTRALLAYMLSSFPHYLVAMPQIPQPLIFPGQSQKGGQRPSDCLPASPPLRLDSKSQLCSANQMREKQLTCSIAQLPHPPGRK